MAYLPRNARSELMTPLNPSGEGVLETSRRFQAACPASQSPGFKPTRGSGFGGAAVPMAGAGDAVPPLPPLEDAHDASAMMPSKRTSEAADEAAVAMRDSG